MSKTGASNGKAAEAAVARYLKHRGHVLLAQNWRTRWCEIDLITQCKATVYFVEVKYRQNSLYGSGLEYITPRKLEQMHFAAELWLNGNASSELTYTIAAAEVSGQDFAVAAWVDGI